MPGGLSFFGGIFPRLSILDKGMALVEAWRWLFQEGRRYGLMPMLPGRWGPSQKPETLGCFILESLGVETLSFIKLALNS